MIAALFNRPQYIRILFVMMLVLFAGIKVVYPVYKVLKAVYKEVAEVASAEESGTEQAAEKDATSGKPYFCNSVEMLNSNLVTVIIKLDIADYAENHLAGHIREINSPPPDLA